jgi:hypothetical protein
MTFEIAGPVVHKIKKTRTACGLFIMAAYIRGDKSRTHWRHVTCSGCLLAKK